MANNLTADELYDRGVSLMSEKRLDESLTAFDKAFELGCSRPKIYPSRYYVLGYISMVDGWVDDSDPDQQIRDVIGPLSHTEEVARLFALFPRMPQKERRRALRPDELEPTPTSSTPSSDAASLSSQVSLVQNQLNSLSLGPDLIDSLPAEILIEIGRYVVLSPAEPLPAHALALAGVCKRWQRIFEDDQALWSHHLLDCASDEAGAEQMVKRVAAMLARAPPRVVDIESWKVGEASLAADDPDLAFELLHGQGATIRELRVDLGYHASVDQVWSVLHPDAPLLETLQMSCSESADINGLCMPSCTASSFPALRTLILHHVGFQATATSPLPGTSLLPLLQLMPTLTDLRLNSCGHLHLVHPSIDGTNRIVLPCLKSLTIQAHEIGDLNGPPPRFNLVAPALESVRLLCNYEGQPGDADKYMDYLFPTDAPPNTSNLRVLELHLPYHTHLDATQTTLLGNQLGEMPLLTDLMLRDVTDYHAGILLVALTVLETSVEVVCPLLERLTLTELGEANDDLLRAMVTSRAEAGRRTAKLRELYVEDDFEDVWIQPLPHWTLASRDMSPATAAWLDATLETFVPSPTWDGGGDVTLEEEDDEDSSDDSDFHSSVDASDDGSKYNSVSESESEWEESDGESEDEEVATDSDASE